MTITRETKVRNMTETSCESSSGLVIGAVFSLAGTTIGSATDIEEIVSPSIECQTPTRSPSLCETNNYDFEKLLRNSPVPIKQCSVRVNNFIEKDIRNKLTEVCNNAIVKQEPSCDNGKDNISLTGDNSTEIAEQPTRRPSRKRKPNSLLSSEYLYKKEDLREFQKLISKKRVKQDEITCQIDHDLVMSVAEKCLPEVIEKSECKEDIKMVSIMPPTLQININDTPVLVDWHAKINNPMEETEIRPKRPQTARTKKKLRTQEQIDKEARESAKRSKPKSKCRTKKKLKTAITDRSPPHLEPYGGQTIGNPSSADTPRSPTGLPPQLIPYDTGSNEACANDEPHKTHGSSTVMEMPPTLHPTRAPQTTNKKHAEGDKRASDVNTVPCSLTGRMRKPNPQYNDYFIMDVPRGAKLSSLDEQISDTKMGVLRPEENTTINHESNTVYVSKLPNGSFSSKTVSQTARQHGTSKVTQPIKKTLHSPVSCATGSFVTTIQKGCGTNPKFTSAIGELAKIENTKKFFQLVVGDKVVLIPTDGNSVVPKAFVMDIAATRPGSSIAHPKATTRPGSSIAQYKATTPKVAPTSNQKTFLMNIGGTQAVTNKGNITQRAQNESLMPNQDKVTPDAQSKPTVPIQKTVSSKQIVPIQPKVVHNPLNDQRKLSQVNILQKTVASTATSNLLTMTRLLAPKPGMKEPPPQLKQNVIIPIVSNSNKPYPTNIVTNSSTTGAPTLTQTPLLYSTLAGSDNTKSQSQITAATNVIPSTGTVIKNEPDNMKEYEKAVESFQGVPNNASDTDSDDETQSAQAERQSAKLKTIIPEIGSHVPSSESPAGERIRKLKEKLRQQQLQVENLRKNLPPKETVDELG